MRVAINEIRDDGPLRLPIGLLTRMGVFHVPAQLVKLQIGETIVEAYFDRALSAVSFQTFTDTFNLYSSVEIVALDRGLGKFREFICGCCGSRRRLLLIENGKLICREGFLRLEDGRSIFQKRKLLTRQGEMSAPLASPRERKTRRPTPQHNSLRKLGTEWGLTHGRGAIQLREFFEFDSMSRPQIEQIAASDFSFAAPLSVGLLDGFPAMDIRWICKHNWFRQRKVRGYQLGWPREATEGYQVTAFFDAREPEVPTIFVARRLPYGSSTWQQLRLVRRHGVAARWCFQCPVSGAPADILYFRSGFFASRTAQRLCYSQQPARGEE